MGRRSFAVRDIAEILEHWHAGRPLQAVARSLGVDRKTVRKYAAVAQAAGFRPGDGQGPPGGWGPWLDQTCPDLRDRSRRGPTTDELDAFRPEIEKALRDVSPTTAWRRLHKERGLRASLASFRRYLYRTLPESAARPQITLRRPDPPPGEEAQVDYGFLGLWLNPLTGRRQALNAFALVLSHSRHMFACAVGHMDQQAWLDSHVAAFHFFGGVPARLVPDNLKAGVLRPDLYDPGFNRGYEELAHHYGFLIDPARVAKPTDKPRVERIIPFLRADFWQGRSFSSLAEINAALDTWCREDAGLRVHGTTRQRPFEVFTTIEQSALRPLPTTPFERALWVQAKVARDCHVQVAGAWYSVPYQHVGQILSVRVTARLVQRQLRPLLAQCYRGYQLIKMHLRVPKGRPSTDEDDYPREKAAFFRRTPDWCRHQARELGPAVSDVVETVLAVQALHHLRQAQGIVRLADKYGPARLNAACACTLAFGDPAYRTIKTILERGLDRQTEPSLDPAAARWGLPPRSQGPAGRAPRAGGGAMTAVHHLQSKLKALKLGGMLDSLEHRVAQAEQEHLGFLDLVELLLEDEVQRRAQHSLAARILRAHFEAVQTFEEFDFAADPGLPAQQIRDLATCHFLEARASVLLCGPVGVGKTHVAQALGVEACRRGCAVLFTKTAGLLRDLAGGRADGTWDRRFRRYLHPDLLILDDFGMKEFTVTQAEDLYELIDARVGRSSLVVASNRGPEDWYPLFPNPVLAESALDRLVNAAHHVLLKGQSYRPRLRPGQTHAVAKEVTSK
ncbi:MAG: IS21-like element helper ATPase IstB [Anaerolineales bacterium]|jgi:DNA replication protein DnaC/transposase